MPQHISVNRSLSQGLQVFQDADLSVGCRVVRVKVFTSHSDSPVPFPIHLSHSRLLNLSHHTPQPLGTRPTSTLPSWILCFGWKGRQLGMQIHTPWQTYLK